MKSIILICALLTVASCYWVQTRGPTSCTTSTPGWFWDGQKCEQCSQNCNCNSLWGCESCDSGHTGYHTVMSSDDESDDDVAANMVHYCKPCSANTASCCQYGTAVNSVTCIADSATMGVSFYNGASCAAQSYCTKYTETQMCESCVSGYYLNHLFVCTACNVAHCATCKAHDQCSTCVSNYYLASVANNAMPTLPSNIQDNAALCSVCNDNCECQDSNHLCTSCVSGHYVYNSDSNGSCTACDNTTNGVAHCDTCTTLGTCTKCIITTTQTTPQVKGVEYVKNNDGSVCEACDENCILGSCTWNNSESRTECSSCANGWYANASKACVACSTLTGEALRCKGDTAATDITQCGSTDSNNPGMAADTTIPRHNVWYLVPADTGVQCLQNTNDCKKMVNSATNAGTCESCYDGYTLTGAATCVHCATDKPHCTKCEKADTTSANLNCLACTTGVQNTVYGNHVVNYYLNSNACSACSGGNGCLSCDTTGQCSECEYGYTYSSTDHTCTSCTVTNCAVCNNGSAKCDKCWYGYRVWTNSDNSSYECETCTAHCKECEGARQTCTSCMDGYFLNGGQCHTPRANCQDHYSDSNGHCNKCEQGFRLYDGYCVRCSDAGTQQSANFIFCQRGCEDSFVTADGVHFEDSHANILKFALSAILVLLALL